MSARRPLVCAPLVLLACCGTPGKPALGTGSGSGSEPVFFTQPAPIPTRLDRDVIGKRADPLIGSRLPGGRPASYPSNQRYRPSHRIRMPTAFARFAAAPDGSAVVVATGVPDYVIVLRDLDRADQDLTIHLGMQGAGRPGWNWHGYLAERAAWCTTPSPMVVLAGERTVWAIDPATWSELPGFPVLLPTKFISAVECLPDGAIAVGEGAGGSDGHGNLTILERSGKLRFSVRVHKYYPRSLAVMPSGVVGSETPTGFATWDPTTGKQLSARTIAPKSQRSFEVDGRMAASPVAEQLAIVIHDFGRLHPFLADAPDFEPHPIAALEALFKGDKDRDYALGVGDTTALAYSPDGRTLVVGGLEANHVWGSDTWDHRVLWVLRDGKLIDTLVGHSGYIVDVAVLADGRILALDDANQLGGGDLVVWEPKP